MTRRLIRVIVFALLIQAVVFGAAGAQEQEKIQLTHMFYSSHGTGWLEYLRDRAQAFGELYPHIEVEIMEGGSGAGYFDKVNLMIAAGTPPDTTDFHPGIAGPFIAQGAFADLRPFLEADGVDLNEITIPAVVEVLTDVDGSIWSLPGDIFPVVTFFNEDLFAEAGLLTPVQLGNDWNWENALSSARKLTIDFDGNGVNDQWGMDRMYARWYIWVQQAGGNLYDRLIDPTTSNWTDPKVAEGFAFPISVFEQNVAPKPGTPGVADYYFWTGRSAISMVDGPGLLRASLLDVPFNWDVAPQVRGPENAGTEIAVSGFQMISQSRHPNETWLWLSFIALDIQSVERFVELTGRTPALAELHSEYPRLSESVPDNWISFFVSGALPQTRSQYVLPEGNAINAVVNPRINQVFTGTIPFETAAQEIHDLVTVILNERHGSGE